MSWYIIRLKAAHNHILRNQLFYRQDSAEEFMDVCIELKADWEIAEVELVDVEAAQ